MNFCPFSNAVHDLFMPGHIINEKHTTKFLPSEACLMDLGKFSGKPPNYF